MKITIFRKLLIINLIIMFCACANKDKSESVKPLKFEKVLHDFGKFRWSHGDAAKSTVFKFSNIGKENVTIDDVKTTCGCTVPEWPKGIIKPNESRMIEIVFEARTLGYFENTISVFYNHKKSTQQLMIKGEVIYP